MRFIKISIFSLFLIIPLQVHGQLAVIDAAASAILKKTSLDQVLYYGQSIAQLVLAAENTFNQVKMMIEAEKRALANLKGIADVKSWDDFMKWQNRQLYMEQQVEDQFKDMGVKIGKETYSLAEIDEIPDALNQNFGDEYWEDFTEEQRRDMYVGLGLSPSNYIYMQTWQEREKALARKLLAQPKIIAEENDAAAERLGELIKKYTKEDGTLDTNQLLKETGITLANLEMLMREQNRLMAEKNEYDLARDKLEDAPANQAVYREDLIVDYWKPITSGSGKDEFID